MQRMLRQVALVTAVGLAGCGGDGAGPSASYDSVAGSYAGVMVGVSQGIGLTATFSLTITQNGGSLSGSWAIQGVLDDGFDTADIQGTGTLTGTVATGNNPSVNIAIRSGFCPSYQANFSGAFDSANQRLTITGPVEILDAGNCGVLLSYQATIILNR